MVNEPKVSSRQPAPRIAREVHQLGEGWDPRELPVLDLHFDFGGHEKVRDFADRMRLALHCGHVHVIAAAVVFGAVPAGGCQRFPSSAARMSGENVYHWGKFSSQRMCLLLHVRQPKRDLVWLLRGGPPPGPAMMSAGRGGSRRNQGRFEDVQVDQATLRQTGINRGEPRVGRWVSEWKKTDEVGGSEGYIMTRMGTRRSGQARPSQGI